MNILDLTTEPSDTTDAIKKDIIKFPINQLTWKEILRMSIVSCLLDNAGKTKEDIQVSIRGSKQPHFRLAKNIIRNIRYRIALRMNLEQVPISNKKNNIRDADIISSCDDDNLLQQMSRVHSDDDIKVTSRIVDSIDCINNINDKLLLLKDKIVKVSPLSIDFNDEIELITQVSNIVNFGENLNYLSIYQRCSKVFLKIIKLSPAKHLIWEVDSLAFPDYYSLGIYFILLFYYYLFLFIII